MGEVYRARDTKLNRDVAIKVLPEAFALDVDRLARFTREAQVLAALNHPNIAAIYGIEGNALVMELVEGEELSAIIARGAIPLADSLLLAKQIADALEAAHEQGIIHRDLKPQNIKVRADGTVKVLDFGLAKAADSGLGTQDSTNSPTLTARATQMGMIIGTAAYMAPEQARGKAVDRRADIWAFGVVLYEMLTGRRAFHGEDISITLASVLKEDVSWDSLPAGLPVPIVRLLRRCLEKDPKRRLSAIGDARIEIDDALQPSSSLAGERAAAAPSPGNARLPWTVAGVASALLLVALGAMWMSNEPTTTPPVVEFTVPTESANPALEVSPDGRLLAFFDRGPNAGTYVIWIRPLSARDAYPIPGTEGASSVFWSPDSQSLGFTASGKLLRVATSGGPVQTIAEVLSPAGATWAPDGTIVFGTATGAGGRMYRVSANGGVPAEIARPDPARQEVAYLWPSMLPDGRRFLFLAQTLAVGERAVYVASLDGGTPVRLMASDTQVKYAAPGQLLFARANTLFTQAFDADTLALTGEATRVAEGVDVRLNNGRAAFSVSTNGVLAYRSSGGVNTRATLTWFDRGGKRMHSVGDPAEYYQIRLSPDGTRVALVLGGLSTQTFRLSVLDLANGVTSTVTDATVSANDAVWPDNQTIGYGAMPQGAGRQIFQQRIGQPGAAPVTSTADTPKWLDDWSADGAYLLYHLPRPSKLFAVKVKEPATPLLLLDTPETVDGAHFSPDGKWVSYQITENGTYQVWVASFPAFDQRRRVSPRDGFQAFWRGDGQELFYLTPEGKMMSARVTRDDKTGALSFSAPTELFQSPIAAPLMGLDQYSVTKDGQRFLFIEPVTAGAATPIAVVVNWTSGLGAR
jgi:serine/threonine protein kinase